MSIYTGFTDIQQTSRLFRRLSACIGGAFYSEDQLFLRFLEIIMSASAIAVTANAPFVAAPVEGLLVVDIDVDGVEDSGFFLFSTVTLEV